MVPELEYVVVWVVGVCWKDGIHSISDFSCQGQGVVVVGIQAVGRMMGSQWKRDWRTEEEQRCISVSTDS